MPDDCGVLYNWLQAYRPATLGRIGTMLIKSPHAVRCATTKLPANIDNFVPGQLHVLQIGLAAFEQDTDGAVIHGGDARVAIAIPFIEVFPKH